MDKTKLLEIELDIECADCKDTIEFSDVIVINQSANNGTSDYNKLKNLPTINGVEVKGDKDFSDYGCRAMTNLEIAKIFADNSLPVI